MRNITKLLAVIAMMILGTKSYAQETPSAILITNAKIFDGTSEKLIEGKDVLIVDNKISKIEAGIKAPKGCTIIDATGKTLTPGLIYMHEHLMIQVPPEEIIAGDTRFTALFSANIARNYLMAGITTVRDAAGNSYALKRAIDQDLTTGPRIYPSGPQISQTSGHADYRAPNEKSLQMGGHLSQSVTSGDFTVADGVPEVLSAVRENLRRGSSQIKIAVGGGTASSSDPLEAQQFTPEEIRAAVQAATDFGTYVMAHVYNNVGIRRAVDNGVLSIEHGNLVDKETLQYMKDKDVWLSPQVTVYTYIPPSYSESSAAKHRQAFAGIDTMFTAAKEIGFENIVVGTDIIGNPEAILTINNELTYRSEWFTPIEIMRQATSKGNELLKMSGILDPYPGDLGVIEVGAFADILLINGNPLDDISILATPEESLVLIMKDGKIYKNTLK